MAIQSELTLRPADPVDEAEALGTIAATDDDIADNGYARVPNSTPEQPLTARGRRTGRPRGPERVPLTVRILTEHDARLTAEVEVQGLSPQYLIERALSEYFARLDRLRSRTH
jgi:hypothetical protein